MVGRNGVICSPTNPTRVLDEKGWRGLSPKTSKGTGAQPRRFECPPERKPPPPLLVFGPKKLPEVARSLGKGLAEFRRASNDLKQSFNLDANPSPPTPPADAANPRTSEQEPEKPAQAVDAALLEPEPEPAPVSSENPAKPAKNPDEVPSGKPDPDPGA